MHRSRLALPAALAATALAAPAAASAADFCVAGAPGCTGTPVTAPNLKAALTAAATNGTADRFFLPPGEIFAGSFAHDSAERVEIVGAGVGQTTLRGNAAGDVLTLGGHAGSLVRDLTLVSANASTGALTLDGTSATRIAFTHSAGVTIGRGVTMRDGARLSHADIRTLNVPAAVNDAGPATVTDSALAAAGQIAFANQGTGTVVRRIRATGIVGVFNAGGSMTLTDSLVDLRGEGPKVIGVAAATHLAATAADATVERVTVVGDEPASETAHGFTAWADGANDIARIVVRDSIATGVGAGIVRRGEMGGEADLAIDRSVYPIGVTSGGPGTLTETLKLGSSVAFADPASGDFRLAADSPYIDAGATTGAADLDGTTRPQDGDGDCTARSDVGAFESAGVAADCTPAPPAPIAPAPPAPAPAPPSAAPPAALPRMVASLVPAPKLSQLSVRRGRARFTLSGPATVELRITRRGAKAVTLRVKARRGANAAQLRLRRKGAYRVTATAVDASGRRSESLTARFRLR